jgi:hypothetical protein
MDSFLAFNKETIVRLPKLYQYDFDSNKLKGLDFELVIYTDNVKACRRFDNLDGIVDLAKLVLQTNKLISFLFAYQPLKLLLILWIATTSVQTCFSVMSVVQKVEKQDE